MTAGAAAPGAPRERTSPLSLIGDSYAAPAAHILEALPNNLVHQALPGAPHTLYQELWHLAFWQQITLDWINGTETPFPANPSDAFPPATPEPGSESWDQLRQRFLSTAEQAAAIARGSRLDDPIRCPSRPGQPVRIMTVRDQLLSLTAHNAYHLGRIVLLRQLLAAAIRRIHLVKLDTNMLQKQQKARQPPSLPLYQSDLIWTEVRP